MPLGYGKMLAPMDTPTHNPHFGGLRTVIYYVADLAAAKAWYSRLLEAAPYFDQPFYVGFNVSGYELGLHPAQEGEARGPHSGGVAYWGVADARAALERLLSLGATQQHPVQDVGEGIKVASVFDPFGNVFAVIENPNFHLP